jgi:hypothetical protein
VLVVVNPGSTTSTSGKPVTEEHLYKLADSFTEFWDRLQWQESEDDDEDEFLP